MFHFDDTIRFVAQRLIDAGIIPYLVGGSVRAYLTGVQPIDYDLAVSAGIEELKRLFCDQRVYILRDSLFCIPMKDIRVEISPLKDSDIYRDLSVRDFTINAMAIDLKEKTLIDPFDGIKDLKNKLIRGVGDPKDRFLEDPLRMLRVFRFMAELGFRVHEDTLNAVRALHHYMASVSKERIRDELKKLLLARSPLGALKAMTRAGLMGDIIPELLEGKDMRQSPPHRHTVLNHAYITVEMSPPSLLLRLSALLHDIAKPRTRTFSNGRYHFYGHAQLGSKMAREVLRGLRFPNTLVDQVCALISNHCLLYSPRWSNKAIRRLIARVQPADIWGLIALRRADLMAQAKDLQALEYLKDLGDRVSLLLSGNGPVAKRLMIDGQEIMSLLNLDPGPSVGKILGVLKTWVIEDPERNQPGLLRRKALELAKALGKKLT